MNKATTYRFSEAYTKYPGGRFKEFGQHSGEAFFEDVLLGLFERNELITLDLSGTEIGFSSSFLDESFGEIAVKLGLDEINRRLTIVIDEKEDPQLRERIRLRMEVAVQAVG